jgi:hypothetical protein
VSARYIYIRANIDFNNKHISKDCVLFSSTWFHYHSVSQRSAWNKFHIVTTAHSILGPLSMLNSVNIRQIVILILNCPKAFMSTGICVWCRVYFASCYARLSGDLRCPTAHISLNNASLPGEHIAIQWFIFLLRFHYTVVFLSIEVVVARSVEQWCRVFIEKLVVMKPEG